MAEVIAVSDLVVHDDNLGIDRKLVAGQPVPPDLVDAYRDEVGDERAAQSPGEAPAANTEVVDALQAQVDEGNVKLEALTAELDAARGDLDGANERVEALEAELKDVAEQRDAAAANASGLSYSDLSPEALQAEADKRKLKVKGTGANGKVLKADLVAALEDNES